MIIDTLVEKAFMQRVQSKKPLSDSRSLELCGRLKDGGWVPSSFESLSRGWSKIRWTKEGRNEVILVTLNPGEQILFLQEYTTNPPARGA